MDLIVNQFGTRIRCSGERIVLFDPKSGAKKQFPARKLSKLTLLGSCSISAGAIALALGQDIDVVFLDAFGMPIGRLVPSAQGSLATLHQKQAALAGTEAATRLATSIVKAKAGAQLHLLELLAEDGATDLSNERSSMSALIDSIQQIAGPMVSARPTLLGLEGSASREYFQALRKRFPAFPGRIHRGASDPFNVLLNYGYGILYNELERCCLHAGLDPHTGFYHEDRPGSRSLVFDLIEEFRVPLVDSVVVRLLQRKSGNLLVREGTLLPKGRKELVSRIRARFDRKMCWQGQLMTVRTAMRMQTYHFSHVLTGKEATYIPFHLHEYEVR